MSGNLQSRRRKVMKIPRKKKDVRRSDSPQEVTRKLLHSEKERTRHRYVMQTLEKLADELPLNKRVYKSKVLPPAETHLSCIDDAIVPDVDFLPQLCGIKEEVPDWELYGISKEDWIAAGSSQQETSSHPCDQEVPTTPSKTYVNLVSDNVMSMPMQEAPEYFVVSSKGEVISLGKLLH